jgi:hypothetical protein
VIILIGARVSAEAWTTEDEMHTGILNGLAIARQWQRMQRARERERKGKNTSLSTRVKGYRQITKRKECGFEGKTEDDSFAGTRLPEAKTTKAGRDGL